MGSHPYPFRTRKLSPSAPMVLGGRPPGRVGRRRISQANGSRAGGHLSFWSAFAVAAVLRLRSRHALQAIFVARWRAKCRGLRLAQWAVQTTDRRPIGAVQERSSLAFGIGQGAVAQAQIRRAPRRTGGASRAVRARRPTPAPGGRPQDVGQGCPSGRGAHGRRRVGGRIRRLACGYGRCSAAAAALDSAAGTR
jgi:hypothetical protein